MKIERVGVVGAGIMGAGICEVAARAGYKVIFSETSRALISSGHERIHKSLNRAVERSKISAEDAGAARERIQGTIELQDLSECELVIEAAPEMLDIKKEIFGRLKSVVKPGAIMATNTSSLSVAEIATVTDRPERVVGLHFFNPAPIMKLVEVIETIMTSDEVFDTAQRFVKSTGKRPIPCRDRAGFIVNFLLSPYLNEAVRMFEQGYASIEDIDAAMKLGTGYPMGPFELLDTIGLDVALAVQESLYEEFREQRWAPAPLLRHLVAAGRLGKKTGRGFYGYAP